MHWFIISNAKKERKNNCFTNKLNAVLTAENMDKRANEIKLFFQLLLYCASLLPVVAFSNFLMYWKCEKTRNDPINQILLFTLLVKCTPHMNQDACYSFN